MDRTRWQQLSALLDEALALTPVEREAWLAVWRERDAELAAQLAPMLAQAGDLDDGDDVGDGAPAAQAAADIDLTQPVAPAQFDRWLGQALASSTATLQASRETVTLSLQRCGSWQLLHKIGEGGMGQVWLARRADGLYEAEAAIKLLRGDVRATRLAARFARERALLARLNHPAIARLLDAGIDNGRAFIVLEHVAGRTLAEHVREHCPTVADRVRLMIRIAEGVDHAHAQLIVHRDLKPSNVLITASGDPKLLDFGIAGVLDAEGQAGDEQLTRQIGRMLTPAYAAPEQVKGESIGIAADVFSLSVMLFELLSGELPFAPRDTDRVALEHALLHKEARRLTQTRPHRRWLRSRLSRPGGTGTGAGPAEDSVAPSTIGPRLASPDAETETPIPPPVDFAKVRGDLEAVVAKGLRKRQDERYGSVRALILDLERWLSHRPVSVRRDDWGHRVQLWLRRNAVVAATLGGVTLALFAGLTASVWQWQRAEAAARQSDQVTRYLSELLASASPDRHGGSMPTVLDLMEASRREIAARFADEPVTLLRLQKVMITSYHALNRFDIAIPLAEQRLKLALQSLRPDDERVIDARFELARAYTATGIPDRVVEQLEPLLPGLRESGKAGWDELSSALYMVAVAYSHLGRFDESQRSLDEAWRIVQAQFAPDDFRSVFFANYVAVLRSAQGRLAEAEAVLARTEPSWATAPKQYARFVLVLRRNLLNARLRLGRYEGYESQARALMADMEALLGHGNDMVMALGSEMGRYYAEIGRADQSLAQYRDIEHRLDEAGVRQAFVRLPLEAARLLAQAQADDGSAPQLLARGRAVLEAIDKEPVFGGLRRVEAWISLVRLALIQGDRWLAAAALERVRADTTLRLSDNPPLRSRIEQLEGDLLRLQGNLAASRRPLEQRVAYLAQWTDKRVAPAWAAQLDLACTLVAAGDPAAAAALARADELRPAQMPAGHPLDAVRAWLQQRLAAKGEQTEAVRNAWAAVERAYRRTPGSLSPALAGLMS